MTLELLQTWFVVYVACCLIGYLLSGGRGK